MYSDVTYWAVGVLAALLSGLAKTGMPGVGIFVVPLMASLFPARLFARLGMITPETLRFNLLMRSAVPAGALGGRLVLCHLPDRIFV